MEYYFQEIYSFFCELIEREEIPEVKQVLLALLLFKIFPVRLNHQVI